MRGLSLVDVLPGEPHAVERAGREVLHQHVALLDQPIEDLACPSDACESIVIERLLPLSMVK